MSLHKKEIEKKKHRAIDLLYKNRVSEARGIYQKLIKQIPDDATVWFMLGTVEGRLNNLVSAEHAMRKSLQLVPDFAEALLGLGQVIELRGMTDDACKIYLTALQKKPQLVEAHASLGRIYLAKAWFAHAAEHLEKAIVLGIKRPSVLLGLADAIRGSGRFKEALIAYRNLSQQFPNDVDLLCKIATIHYELNELEEADKGFRQALKLAPGNVGAKLGVINIQYHNKQYDDALPEIQKLFVSQPNNLAIPVFYSQLCHLDGSCEKLVVRLEGLLNDERIDAKYERLISFALGRLYDMNNEYDKAFACYKRGNDLKAGQYDYSATERTASAIIEGYNSETMEKKSSIKRNSPQPLFIIGMPRSGTSLTEQILASHPQIYGAGELTDMSEILNNYRGPSDVIDDINHEAETMTVDELDVMATKYLDRLESLAGNERYVSDKLPSNYTRLGLISMLFPQAKIIHVRRNPVDTCLSCYFQDFSGFHTYAYELESLVNYYKNYQRLMRHWCNNLPGEILEIDYEELVANPETTVQRMLEYLGLDWDEQCLQFHKSERAVITSSHSQVQSHIYNKSVSRWKNYEKYIEPLIKGLA